MAHMELRRSVLPLVLLATIVLAGRYGHSSAPRPVRQVKVSRSDRSSVDEEFWKTAISSAAIPKATIALSKKPCP